MQPPLTPEFKTTVTLAPERSQVYVIGALVVSAACLLTSFAFVWYKHDMYWIPLLVGLAFAAASGYAWHKSHSNSDLNGGTPTTISASGDTVHLTTDTRALNSNESVHALEMLISVLCNRVQLPEPDGIIDAGGNPIPDSKALALELVRQANEEAERIKRDAARFITGTDMLVEQPNVQIPETLPDSAPSAITVDDLSSTSAR